MNWIFESTINWTGENMFSTFEALRQGFTTVLDLNLDTFLEIFDFAGIFSVLSEVIRYFAFALLCLILIWQLFRTFGGPLNDTQENPLALLARGALFTLLIYYAVPVFNYILNLCGRMYSELNIQGVQWRDISWADLADNESGVVSWMLVCLIGCFLIFWNYIKFLFEIAERYIMLGVLAYTSPLAYSTGVSSSTSNIFRSWVRMAASSVILMFLNVWFLSLASSGISYLWMELEAEMVGKSLSGNNILLTFLCVLGLLKIGQRADTYLAMIGLYAAPTGIGTAAMGAVRNVLSSVPGAASRFFGGAGGGGGNYDGGSYTAGDVFGADGADPSPGSGGSPTGPTVGGGPAGVSAPAGASAVAAGVVSGSGSETVSGQPGSDGQAAAGSRVAENTKSDSEKETDSVSASAAAAAGTAAGMPGENGEDAGLSAADGADAGLAGTVTEEERIFSGEDIENQYTEETAGRIFAAPAAGGTAPGDSTAAGEAGPSTGGGPNGDVSLTADPDGAGPEGAERPFGGETETSLTADREVPGAPGEVFDSGMPGEAGTAGAAVSAGVSGRAETPPGPETTVRPESPAGPEDPAASRAVNLTADPGTSAPSAPASDPFTVGGPSRVAGGAGETLSAPDNSGASPVTTTVYRDDGVSMPTRTAGAGRGNDLNGTDMPGPVNRSSAPEGETLTGASPDTKMPPVPEREPGAGGRKKNGGKKVT